MPEYIKASGTKGFQKTEVEVIVRSPSGRSKQILLGEVSHIKRDRRHSKRTEYVRLCSLSQVPRCDLTYNVATKKYSLTFHQGFHHGYIVLDEMREAAMIAVLYSLTSRSKRLNVQKIGGSYKHLPLLSKWYLQQFKKNIRIARARWFKHKGPRR